MSEVPLYWGHSKIRFATPSEPAVCPCLWAYCTLTVLDVPYSLDSAIKVSQIECLSQTDSD